MDIEIVCYLTSISMYAHSKLSMYVQGENLKVIFDSNKQGKK